MANEMINMTIGGGQRSVGFGVTVNDTQRTPVDDTLTIAGMAADAKAAGDAIRSIVALTVGDIDEAIEDAEE